MPPSISSLNCQQKSISGSDLTAHIASALAITAGFFFLLFVYGLFIGGIVFREPDICFLLASGLWIVEHAQLPTVDPFSYTTSFNHIPYVIEKWLSEVIFFQIWTATGAQGLLIFDAIITTSTFVIAADYIVKCNGIKGSKAIFLNLLCAFGSLSHLSIRPEIFSFLFTAILLSLLTKIAKRPAAKKTASYGCVGLAFVIMMLWCNLHTLFILAVLLPALYSVCSLIELKSELLKGIRLDSTVPLMCLAAFGASMLNPYSFAIWTYLPYVFGAVCKNVHEMQPMGLSQLKDPLLYPYFLFAIISSVCFMKKGFKRIEKRGDLFFRIVIPLALEEGFRTLRAVPLADLLLLAGSAWLLQEDDKSLDDTTIKLAMIDSISSPTISLLVLLFPVLGVVFASFCMPLKIPQGSLAFTPPENAIAFVTQHQIGGNLLNEAHFGNVMMWRLKKSPRVFVDSRYNLFGEAIVEDHWKMILCHDGWKQLLEKYSIDWVFVMPERPIVNKLSKDPNWRILYKDEVSCILARRQNQKGVDVVHHFSSDSDAPED